MVLREFTKAFEKVLHLSTYRRVLQEITSVRFLHG